MGHRTAANHGHVHRLLRLAAILFAATAVSATRADALSVTLHPIPTPGFEEAEAIQGAPGGLILKGVVDRRSVLQRITTAPFGVGPPMFLEASAIGIGPDGTVWATVESGGSWVLGGVTAAGFAPSHALAGTSSQMLPDLIASGPDGSVWVGDLLGGDVVRVYPDGHAVDYQGPDGPGYATGIAFGADGTAWVTEAGTYEHIWEITPSGQVLDREIPSPSGEWGNCHCDARSITAGSDGSLWFVERMFGRIERVTEAGEWTALTLPNPANVPIGQPGAPRPEALTEGPEGGLWFIEAGNGELGRITLAGGVQVSELPVPPVHPGAQITLQGLTVAGDELWGIAVEALVTAGVTRFRGPVLVEVDPNGVPQPAATAPVSHATVRRIRCRGVRRHPSRTRPATAASGRMCRRAPSLRRAR